jgi:hypothetical protein
MVQMKKFVMLMLMTVFVIAFTGCGRHIAQQKTVNQNITYLCPMHNMYLTSAPGKCPKCGMQLISFDDYRKSKSGTSNQNRMTDSHTGVGGSSGGHTGHH